MFKSQERLRPALCWLGEWWSVGPSRADSSSRVGSAREHSWRLASSVPRCRSSFCRTSARLKNRGLLDSTLVVWGGEFGRTVYCQGGLTRENYGRDHHPRCFTMWMAEVEFAEASPTGKQTTSVTMWRKIRPHQRSECNDPALFGYRPRTAVILLPRLGESIDWGGTATSHPRGFGIVLLNRFLRLGVHG